MFDNINWNKIINDILSHTKKGWKHLVIKINITKRSISEKYYYSINYKDYIDLFKQIDNKAISETNHNLMSELKPLTDKFTDNEKMFLTVKVERNGNVKVLYKDFKEGNKIPFDESNKYLLLNQNDKTLT